MRTIIKLRNLFYGHGYQASFNYIKKQAGISCSSDHRHETVNGQAPSWYITLHCYEEFYEKEYAIYEENGFFVNANE